MEPQVSDENSLPAIREAGDEQSFYTEPNPFERAWARLLGLSAQVTALQVSIDDHASGKGSGLGDRVQSDLLYGMQMTIEDIMRDMSAADCGGAA